MTPYYISLLPKKYSVQIHSKYIFQWIPILAILFLFYQNPFPENIFPTICFNNVLPEDLFRIYFPKNFDPIHFFVNPLQIAQTSFPGGSI